MSNQAQRDRVNANYRKHGHKYRERRKQRYYENLEKEREAARERMREIRGTVPRPRLGARERAQAATSPVAGATRMDSGSRPRLRLKPGEGHPDNVDFVREWREKKRAASAALSS
jgi:hypothetical protein